MMRKKNESGSELNTVFMRLDEKRVEVKQQ